MNFDRFIRELLIYDADHMQINEKREQLVWIWIKSDLSKHKERPPDKKTDV